MFSSLKLIGRRKVQFHLDDLVNFSQPGEDNTLFQWVCLLAEPGIYQMPIGHVVGGLAVSCGEYGRDYPSLEDAAEAALEHVVNEHRGQGGERLVKSRGRERRERLIEQWNDRRRSESGVHGE